MGHVVVHETAYSITSGTTPSLEYLARCQHEIDHAYTVDEPQYCVKCKTLYEIYSGETGTSAKTRSAARSTTRCGSNRGSKVYQPADDDHMHDAHPYQNLSSFHVSRHDVPIIPVYLLSARSRASNPQRRSRKAHALVLRAASVRWVIAFDGNTGGSTKNVDLALKAIASTSRSTSISSCHLYHSTIFTSLFHHVSEG